MSVINKAASRKHRKNHHKLGHDLGSSSNLGRVSVGRKCFSEIPCLRDVDLMTVSEIFGESDRDDLALSVVRKETTTTMIAVPELRFLGLK